MTPLVVVGTGGFGREVHELLEDGNADTPTWDVLGFVDDDETTHGTTVHDLPVLGGIDWLGSRPGTAAVLGIGSPAVKARLVARLTGLGVPLPSVVHPSARIGRRVRLGAGVVVCAGAHLTTDVTVGSYVTLNLGVTVGHDCTLGDYVTAAPGVHVSGEVALGEGVDLGTGATLIQRLTVGEWSVVGAGASVVRDLPPNVTAVGVPARTIREREPGWHR
jgi:sugar O-acyltransferase (sialic acid O-acetyltransferase NeuD family)